MNLLELFSGAGGLAKGLELAGFTHTALVEWDKDACTTLRANFGQQRVFEGDARDFDFVALKNVDVIAGGPPCQPFSLGGKHRAQLDARDMFPIAIQAVRQLKPKAFIFENVKGLLRAAFADYLAYVLLRLSAPDHQPDADEPWLDHLARLRQLTPKAAVGARYEVSCQLLNAADYGVPQCRERVVIVGFLSGHFRPWQYPSPTHSEEALLWQQWGTGGYWQRHGIAAASPDATQQAWVRQQRFALFPPATQPWRTVRDALQGLPHPASAHKLPDHIFRDGARSYPGHTGSALDAPAKTLKAGDHGVPGGENMLRNADGSVRYFTVAEAKRIQTFPDDYQVTGAWTEAMRQLGNAVPVSLGQVIGQAMRAHLLQGAAAQLPLPPQRHSIKQPEGFAMPAGRHTATPQPTLFSAA